jgi:hypothetical protein
MHDHYVQLRMSFLSDATLASLTPEAISMPQRRNNDENAIMDALWPKVRATWIDKNCWDRLDTEMVRQQAAAKQATSICPHCGASQQWLPDLDGVQCLTCGFVAYKRRRA